MTDATTRQEQQLAIRFEAFNQGLMSFVDGCTDADWQKITPAEGWKVGVTARHIGVGHYPLVGLVQLIVEGQPLPDLTMDDINQANDQHALEHANCTKAEVTEILQTNSAKALDYLVTLDDGDLAREGYFSLFDTDFTAGKLFDLLLIEIANVHLDSMKAAVAG